MVMKVALNVFQAKQPITHHCFAPCKAQFSGIDRSSGPACRLPRRSCPLTSCASGNHRPSISRRFLEDKSPDWFQDLALNIPSCHRSMSGLSCSRPEFPPPSVLGIRPDPPDWAERSDTVRISIEQRANRVDIPLSIRMIKMKRRQVEAGLGLIDELVESTNCSVRRAFSSFALIIRELQMQAVHRKESGLGGEELKEIGWKVQRDINASLVWLFRQVFPQTPTLMVSVMILLANYSVYSMVGNSAAASPVIALSETITEVDKDENQGVIPGEESPVILFDDDRPSLSGEEDDLWRGILEEVGEMRGEVLGEETVQGFVAPVTVKVDTEQQMEHLRTDLLYQMNLSRDPDNPLLLCNYAQFLAHISHDYNRAEEYFKKVTQLEQPDAEALSRYADFLFVVREDMWGAEERYQQAIAVEPDNPFYASKYASFLWSTGGEETCFPLTQPD